MPIDLTRFLNSHKNKLLEVIRKSGLPLNLFDAEEEKTTFTIKVIGTPLQFRVFQTSYAYENLRAPSLRYSYSEFKPGFPFSDWVPWARDEYVHISAVAKSLEEWLKKVVNKYIELDGVPDLWSDFKNIQPFVSGNAFSPSDFEMFTEKEKSEILEALSQFETLLKNEMAGIKDDLSEVKEKLDYLKSAVDRLNRFDWKGVALSTIMGIATNLSVDTNTGSQILDLFQQAFSSAARLLPK